MSGVNGSEAQKIIAGALVLIAEGLPCFPCRSDKRPATPHGVKDAVLSREAALELWERYPGPLIGIPTGEASGLDVLDIGPRHGGDRWLAQQQYRLPPTRVHRSRSGGLHLFFRHDFEVRCSAGWVGPGVDVRASGGYIVWWPAAGIEVISGVATAPWPDWLRVNLPSRPRPAIPRVTVPDALMLARLVQMVAGASAGERNNVAYWAACRAGEMVASELLGADAAAALIAEAATRAGLPHSEAERTAWSGIFTTGGLAHA